MKNLSIKLQLILLVSLAVVALVLQGIAGSIGVRQVDRSFSLISQESLPALNELVSIRMWQLKALLISREASAWNPQQFETLDDPSAEARGFYSALLTDKQQIEQHLNEAYQHYAQRKKSQEEQALWSELEADWQAWQQAAGNSSKTIALLATASDWTTV
ncbi:Tar ligand binding domain-containing protein, partial [Pseudomonas corrugata]|uniref:Tar ligand binding domain-containing protein n=1 Tax=Pseudomonas corrugata TaxID=47879 RepID=UPI001F516E5B